MIQLDEKIPPPPAYTNVGGTLYPPAQAQSPTATGQSQYATPTLQSPQGYPPTSPLGSAAQMNQRPQPSPGQMEAQLGSQYQQQLFARCARGDHDVVNKYGPCGIITAVLLFPIGLICLFMDVDRKCSRCGTTIS